jgi:NAD+ kinase
MKVAIYGQYYQNSTEPIIKDIFIFLIKQCELVIEAAF